MNSTPEVASGSIRRAGKGSGNAASGRSRRKESLDRYYTPHGVARACVNKLAAFTRLKSGKEPSRIYDPAVGGGVFADELSSRFPSSVLTVVDIDPKASGLNANSRWMALGDALSQKYAHFAVEADVIATNPPYALAAKYLDLGPHAFVGLLVRLAWLEGKACKARPPAEVWILPRFAFGGPDSVKREDGEEDNYDAVAPYSVAIPHAFMLWSPVKDELAVPQVGWISKSEIAK